MDIVSCYLFNLHNLNQGENIFLIKVISIPIFMVVLSCSIFYYLWSYFYYFQPFVTIDVLCVDT